MEILHTTLLQLRVQVWGASTVVVPPFIAQEQANPAAAGATHYDVNFVLIFCMAIHMYLYL